jgi:hypothetical protein
MRSVARRETEQVLTACDWSFDVNMRDLIQVIPYLNINHSPLQRSTVKDVSLSNSCLRRELYKTHKYKCGVTGY